MGAVALDPVDPSIVYAGSGNHFAQTGLAYGLGIYKSGDGGDTWNVQNPAGIFTGLGIQKIAVLDGNVVLVGTTSGLYRSVDGGTNFGNNSPLFNNGSPTVAGYITDLDVDTALATTVYASVYGSGLFKSTDAGATFPSSGNLFTTSNGGPTNALYIAFAQSAQPDNQTMYVNVQLSGPGPAAVMFKSTDGGANWTQVTLGSSIIDSLQRDYDQTVGVDPQDANRVFIGMRALYLATDGGAGGFSDANRIDFNKVHADQHALVFSPSGHWSGPAPTRFYNGTDGGIATSTDGGVSWSLLAGSTDCSGMSGALATVQFYQMDIGRGSTANNVYTYGAAQDLGLSSHTPDCLGTPWHLGLGGDGYLVAVDPLDPKHALGKAGYPSYIYATTDSKSWLGAGGAFPAGVASSVSKLLFDPNGGVAYAIAWPNQLYRSTDNGSSFSLMNTFAPGTVGLTTIAMAGGDSNTVWLGRSDGAVWFTTNANDGASATWTPGAVTGAPSEAVAGLAIAPSNTREVVVVYASNHVFRTTNQGGTWDDIRGSLSGLPIRAVVIDPNTSPYTIIVANDTGVMRTANLGGTWEALGVGLPNVECSSLAIDSTAIPSLLRVGTYGRSVFELAYDRQYVDWRNIILPQNGTRELPFRTVSQGVSAPATGDRRFVNIQAGSYAEAPISISQCGTLNALNGVVRIH
jgi:photosystem II stability/assembly factor-like uncharacterized protein